MRSMWAIAIAAWALASSASAQAQSDPAEPIEAEPSTAAPSTAAPSTAAPSTAEPSTAEPSTAEPSTAEPSTAEPSTAEPSTPAEIEIELESLVVTEPDASSMAPRPSATATAAHRPVRTRQLETTARRLPPPAMDEGSMLLYTLAGELLGVGIGGLVAVGMSALAGCRNGEGWISGYTCGSGYGFATAMGALIAAPLGGALSLARAAGARGEGGNGWAALGGAAVGLGIFALLTPILAATTDQLTLSYAIGGISGLVTATALTPILYALSRPARRPNVAIGLLSVRAEF